MAWSPRHIDKPLRFIFEPETWVAVFLVMGFCIFILKMNQALAVAVSLFVGAVVQKVVDRHKRGYIVHLLYAFEVLRIFPPCGKYRF